MCHRIPNGRMLLSAICGPPLTTLPCPWARITVPCADRGHPHDRRRLLRVRCRRRVGPDSWLDVQPVPIARLGNLLHVGETEQVDVVHL